MRVGHLFPRLRLVELRMRVWHLFPRLSNGSKTNVTSKAKGPH